VAGDVAVSYEKITAPNYAHSVVPWTSAAPSKVTKRQAAPGPTAATEHPEIIALKRTFVAWGKLVGGSWNAIGHACCLVLPTPIHADFNGLLQSPCSSARIAVVLGAVFVDRRRESMTWDKVTSVESMRQCAAQLERQDSQ
jgi:hypothetical protein